MDLHRALDIWEQAGEGDKMKRRIKKGWCQTVLMPELIDEKPSFFQFGMAKAPKRGVNTDWVCLGGRDGWRSRRECPVWRWFGAYPGKKRKGGCIVVKAKKSWGAYLFLRVMHSLPPPAGQGLGDATLTSIHLKGGFICISAMTVPDDRTPARWENERNHSSHARSSRWCQAGGLKCQSNAGS